MTRGNCFFCRAPTAAGFHLVAAGVRDPFHGAAVKYRITTTRQRKFAWEDSRSQRHGKIHDHPRPPILGGRVGGSGAATMFPTDRVSLGVFRFLYRESAVRLFENTTCCFVPPRSTVPPPRPRPQCPATITQPFAMTSNTSTRKRTTQHQHCPLSDVRMPGPTTPDDPCPTPLMRRRMTTTPREMNVCTTEKKLTLRHRN